MVPAHAANNCLISDYCLNYQAISGSSTLKAEEHDHAKRFSGECHVCDRVAVKCELLIAPRLHQPADNVLVEELTLNYLMKMFKNLLNFTRISPALSPRQRDNNFTPS
jgi:hypothetical protein